MTTLTPTGMNADGLFTILSPGDNINALDANNTTDLNKPISTAVQTALNAKQAAITLGSAGQYVKGDLTLGTLPAIPSVIRTSSALTLSLVGTGATGTQISSTKDSSVRLNISTSTTANITTGSAGTSLIALKICSTNNATEGGWTTVATLESDQTIGLAIALNSVQTVKGQLCADVPATWYCKLVNSGTGTHSESFISGQQTIYG